MNASRLSVVITTRTGLPELRPVLSNLCRQTVAREIELIIVAPRGGVEPEEISAVEGFRSVTLLEIDRVVNRGSAAAQAILRARTPFVGLHENHAFPAIDTLERLIEDRSELDAGVAPSMRAANPETRRSLAMFLLAYGHVAAPAHPAPRDLLPDHSAVYRTEALQAFGDRLPGLMEEEIRLQRALSAKGLVLRVHPHAPTWHINESRWSRTFSDPFVVAMRFGADRAAAWGLARRVAYALAWPAVVALRLRQLVRMGRRATDTCERIGWLAPMLALAATVGALGEVWGYLAPETPMPRGFQEHEFHIRSRLAGIELEMDWIRGLVSKLPVGLP